MNKNNENNTSTKLSAGLVPKLRFPEFVNDGEWCYPNGDELFEPIANKNHNSDLPILAITQDKGAVPRDMIDYHVSVTDKSVESYKVVEIGDFIISLRSFQGGIEYSFYKGLCSPAYIILRKKINLENDFYRHYFKSVPFIRDLNRNLEGIRDGKMISYKQFSEILIPKPKLKEQQKIASCLLSLDEVITAENQKLEVLKDHKKGLLQNLFPQEGETVPKLRFKEFEGSGEWALDAFSEYIKLYRGSSPRPIQNYFTTDESGVNWIKIGDTKNADNFIIKQVEERITPEGAEKSRKVNVGELILANSMSFGKTYQLAIEGYIYDGWFVLREYEKHFDKHFLLQLLNSDYMQSQYKKLSAGGIVQNISSDIVYNTTLPHTSLNEQKKIASCLLSLDEIISAQSQKIETLKLHKKGLLQGLFPGVNET